MGTTLFLGWRCRDEQGGVPIVMVLAAGKGRKLNEQKGRIYIVVHALTEVCTMCLTTEDRRLPQPTPRGPGDQVGPSKELIPKWTKEGSITSYQLMRYAGD